MLSNRAYFTLYFYVSICQHDAADLNIFNLLQK